MKKYYLRIVFLIVLFIAPITVKAECNYKDRVRLQKLAGNVNFGYRYQETKYSVTFEIIVSNLTNEIYMIDRSTGKYHYSNNEDFTLTNYQSGDTIRFDFYAKDASCTDEKLFTNYVTLPTYNPYYSSDICKGIENFELCQKWLKHSMTYKEFYDGVTKYLNKQEIIPEPAKPEEEFNWDAIIEFWADYYLYILLTIIIVGGIILYFHDKKSDL
ncbi:MAG: hypothetical protein HFH08_01520 [Bacilli bacterium]|nr:hypothetical protein [Bacilli bacterium]